MWFPHGTVENPWDSELLQKMTNFGGPNLFTVVVQYLMNKDMLSINCLCRLSICSAMVKMSIKMSANCYCFGNNVNYEHPTVLTNICFTIPSIQLQLQNYCEGVLRATQTTLNCVLHTLILPLLTGLHFHVISKRLIPVLILTYKQLQCYLDVLMLFTVH